MKKILDYVRNHLALTIGIAALVVIATVVTIIAVSCGGGETELAIKEDAMPQLVHVLGEELDLSNGVLVSSKGKKSIEIAMNADGVEISGYNKNQLGEQTVTVSYNGVSTTFTVTVVERMQIVDYVVDYLVGDSFDTSKGRLRINKNDGTSYTVILNNASVSIEGFDTSVAASGKNVTVKYTSGEESYETTFAVNVHAIDEITLQAPNKKAYSSHEKGIVLDGGRLVLSGNNGTLTREIKLDDATAGITIEGFDLTAVNEENTTTTQRIYVKYDGQSYYYDIKISYTSVSMFNDHANEFADFDWESETIPTIDADLGEFALELMAMYVELPTAEAVLISNEDLINVARVAVIYGYNAWLEDVVKFEGAFTYDYDDYYESYSIFVTCETYDDVVNAIKELQVEDRPLYRMYHQLVKISEIESIYDEIIEYIETPIIGDAMFTALIPMFEHMIELHDDYLPLLPNNWQTAGYSAYTEEIIAIYEFIVGHSYIDGENSWIYEQVAYWYDSENEIKTFDALYDYYYAENDWEALCNLANVTLPSDFLELITKLDGLMTTLDSIEAGDVYDNTTFFYDYYAFVEYAKTYEFHSEEMIATIYSQLPVNTLFAYDDSDEIYIATLVDYLYYGYAQIASTLIELDAFENLMEDYLNAYVIASNNADYISDPEFAACIEGMMAHFFELTTTQQNLFFGAIMPYYYYGAPEFAFGAKESELHYVARFNNYILEYYNSIFENANADAAFKTLLVANEIYSRRFDLETWISEFNTKMTAFNESFALLSDDDKALFDNYFGGLRATCEKVWAGFTIVVPETATPPEVLTNEYLLGTWYGSETGVSNYEGDHTFTIIINSDGTGTVYHSRLGALQIANITMNGNHVMMELNSETDFTISLEYNNGVFTLAEGNNFTGGSENFTMSKNNPNAHVHIFAYGVCECGYSNPDYTPSAFEEKWQAIFDELAVAIKAMDDASYVIEEGLLDSEGYYFYNVFLAAYERAQKLVNYILSEGTSDVIYAYYHEPMYVMTYEYDDGGREEYHHTYEYAYSGLRGYYILYRIYTAGSSDDYKDLGFAKFFDLAYDLIIPYFNSMLYSDIVIDITGDELVEIMTTYSKLSSLAKAYHLLMEGGVYSTYYGAIGQYSGKNYTENVAKLISAITELEYTHSFYYYYTEVAEGASESTIQKSLDDVKSVYENLTELYAALSTEEAAEFAPFADIYSYYIELTEQMIADYEAANAN